MTHAYDEDYLYHAQRNFGHMVDFAVNTCGYNIDDFFQMFFESNVCIQFEDGNPAYIAGKTGCELARQVVWEVNNMEIPLQDVMYADKSPEYWLGWVLAYYVWLRNCKFSYVFRVMSAEDMLGMYNTLHESDISKAVKTIDSFKRCHRK